MARFHHIPAALKASVPPEFVCPLTTEVMRDPVMIASGESFSRAAIEAHFASVSPPTHPLTGLLLPSANVTPNIILMQNITGWMESMGIVDEGGGGDGEESSVGETEEEIGDPQTSIDMDALLDLYSVTSGETCWENNDGWDDPAVSENVNEWWGVTLSRVDRKLIRVKLVDNGLEGFLPTTLNNFKNLIILNLSKNYIEGNIPEL